MRNRVNHSTGIAEFILAFGAELESPSGGTVRVRVLMIAEMDVEAVAEIQEKLDAFRESVLPGPEYGITVYRTQEPVGDLFLRGVEVLDEG
jgi:hypothetical protein